MTERKSLYLLFIRPSSIYDKFLAVEMETIAARTGPILQVRLAAASTANPSPLIFRVRRGRSP
jgi:hypothetical protein